MRSFSLNPVFELKFKVEKVRQKKVISVNRESSHLLPDLSF